MMSQQMLITNAWFVGKIKNEVNTDKEKWNQKQLAEISSIQHSV